MAIFPKTLERNANGNFPVYDPQKGVVVYPRDNHYHLAMSLFKMSKNKTMKTAQTLLSFDEAALDKKWKEIQSKKEEKTDETFSKEIEAKAVELCNADMIFIDLKSQLEKAKEANDEKEIKKLKDEIFKIFRAKCKEAKRKAA